MRNAIPRRACRVALLATALIVLVAPAAGAQTYVSGPISTSLWGPSGAPYIVTGDVTVAAGATLTIAAGTEVRFAGGVMPDGADIQVNGTLDVQGTAEQPVRFTSDEAAPAAGAWGGIRLWGPTSTLRHAVVEYGTYGLRASSGNAGIEFSAFRHNRTANLVIEGGGGLDVTIAHSTFADSHGDGTAANPGYGISLQQVGGSIAIIDSAFERNGIGLNASTGGFTFARNRLEHNQTGVALYNTQGVTVLDNAIAHNQTGVWTSLSLASSSFSLQGNTIAANALFAWDNDGPRDVVARANWWGGTSAGAIAAAIHDGDDVPARGRVLFDPPLGAPSVSAPVVDVTPPTTVIDSGPIGASSATTAVFQFSAEDGAGFECRLDGPAGGGWTACASGQSYGGLTDRFYTFDVRATDAAGNVELVPATRSWTVDTSPPDTVLDSAPPAITALTTVSFGFSSEPGATFECRMDAGQFAACTSPHSAGPLAVGSHTFAVRARDRAGNVDDAPATAGFELTAPPAGETTRPDTPIPPVTTPPPNDTVAPVLIVAGRTRQPLGRSIALRATCRGESCRARVTGVLSAGGRRYRCAGLTRRLAADKSTTVNLSLSQRARTAARRALRNHRTVSVRVTVLATNAAGKSATRRVTITLRDQQARA